MYFNKIKTIIVIFLSIIIFNCGDVTREILRGTSPQAEKECREDDVFFYLVLPILISDTLKDYYDLSYEAGRKKKSRREIEKEYVIMLLFTTHLNEHIMKSCIRRSRSYAILEF